MKRAIPILVGVASLLGGCATLPPIDYQYPMSKGSFAVSMTQSVDCNKSGTAIFVVNGTPTVATSYSANMAAPMMTVAISGTKSQLADSDFTFGFYDDGRLKSINGSTTGQGETILKQVISTAAAAAAMVGGVAAPVKGAVKPKMIAECKALADWGKGKPVTITYSANLPMPMIASPVEINADSSSAELKSDLDVNHKIPKIQAQLDLSPIPIEPAIPRIPPSDQNDYVYLPLQHVRSGTLSILAGGAPIWTATVLVPMPLGPPGQKDEPYLLPISKARLFGKSQIVLAVSEAGSVTSIEYARNVGGGGAADVLTSALTAAAPESDVDKAAAKKAQVDEIVYNQKLVHCRAQPETCTD